MSKLTWDKIGERFFETGVDHGVLYPISEKGEYNKGVAWSGLTAVTESPSGAEANPQYADNIKYLNLISTEDFGGTIEAFYYPDEWKECDGSKEVAPGVTIGQQNRKTFGLAYRTKLGNDVEGQDYGYKLHLVYGAVATPSERNYQTVNDSPEATALSWEFTTTPVEVGIEDFKPTACMVIDSTKTTKEKMAQLEAILYGSEDVDPRLPLPKEVIELLKDDAVG